MHCRVPRGPIALHKELSRELHLRFRRCRGGRRLQAVAWTGRGRARGSQSGLHGLRALAPWRFPARLTRANEARRNDRDFHCCCIRPQRNKAAFWKCGMYGHRVHRVRWAIRAPVSFADQIVRPCDRSGLNRGCIRRKSRSGARSHFATCEWSNKYALCANPSQTFPESARCHPRRLCAHFAPLAWSCSRPRCYQRSQTSPPAAEIYGRGTHVAYIHRRTRPCHQVPPYLPTGCVSTVRFSQSGQWRCLSPSRHCL